MLTFEVATLKRAIQTLPEEAVCGDVSLVVEEDETLLLALFDGAGHGPMAFRAAKQGSEYLKQHTEQDLEEALQALNLLLRGTSGAVASMCRIHKETGLLTYSGIGNVSMRLFSPESRHLVTRDGMLGHQMPSPKQNTLQLHPGNIFMLYSDGVKEHFDAEAFPDFFALSAQDIARIIIDYFSKTLDDASCIVVKVHHD